MALAKGVNSYVTAAEADTYFLDRLTASAWSALTTPAKEQALVTATSMLDESNWTGSALSGSQALAFPRSGSYFDPKLGINVTFTNAVPGRLLSAVCELALYLSANPDVYSSSGSVKDLKIGTIELTGISEAASMPQFARNLIKPLLVNAGSNTWWRAN